ncbi:MAG TPA: di-heme-cytochrome C peroxidase, partial [Planctomycetaceae bacterium]|nr:di-heme-cytochrome C peroxidase [Planctomycetaceae bacterium]
FAHSTTIDQGWNADDRDIFWYLPQGAYIIPYDWFLALTDPATGKPLRDSLESFGFLHADDEASVSGRILNPDKLPIGMSRETPPGNAFPDLRGNGDWIGITCAACHVGAVTINETRFIIDGAPSALNFEKFSLAIEASLDALLKADAAEFTRFQNQLPSPAPDEARLRESVSQVLDRLASRNTRSFFHGLNRAYGSVNAGPGRTDAFGVILNEVAARALEGEGNAKTATAPVSFPQLWGAPDEEWVQYSGLSNNAFTRNVGQVLGVFGDVILDPKSNDFLATTARSSNLQVLEEKLRTLKAPNWEQVFSSFTAQEYKQIHRGEAVYSVTCARCHSENPQIVTMVPFAEFGQDGHRNRPSVGTDPLYFVNLARSWTNADTGLLKGNSVLGELERKDSEIASLFRKPYLSTRFDARYAPRGNMIEILSDATTGIALKYMKDNRILFDLHDQKFNYLTGGALPIRQTHIGAFKARSLRGIAFTGPYFHNGSVRTLREVLSPEERSTEFFLGGTGYDQANGGFENAGTFLFRANKMGNLNIGHDFAAQLSPAEKEDLLMYLKSL